MGSLKTKALGTTASGREERTDHVNNDYMLSGTSSTMPTQDHVPAESVMSAGVSGQQRRLIDIKRAV